jgi:hypothetical protein
MSEFIDPDDVYHVLHTILNELPPGTAMLERDPKWGRSQLTPTRGGAAALYGIGNVEDCEIGIVETTHSHFDNWKDAIEFCRTVVSGEIEYTVWRDGTRIVRAQRHHEPLSDGGERIDVMEALFRDPPTNLRKGTPEVRTLYPHLIVTTPAAITKLLDAITRGSAAASPAPVHSPSAPPPA